MNDFSAKVLPDTRALIWFPKSEVSETDPHYRHIDYLSDGILTTSLSTLKDKSSLLLVGKSFGKPLMIFIIKELIKTEIESFVGLLPKDDGEILVLDDGEQMSFLKSTVSAEIWSKLKRA